MCDRLAFRLQKMCGYAYKTHYCVTWSQLQYTNHWDVERLKMPFNIITNHCCLHILPKNVFNLQCLSTNQTMMTLQTEKGNQRKCLLSTSTFVSTLQFTSCMGNGAWSKFSSLYFLENGVTPSQLGILNSVQSITKLIGYPTLSIPLLQSTAITF